MFISVGLTVLFIIAQTIYTEIIGDFRITVENTSISIFHLKAPNKCLFFADGNFLTVLNKKKDIDHLIINGNVQYKRLFDGTEIPSSSTPMSPQHTKQLSIKNTIYTGNRFTIIGNLPSQQSYSIHFYQKLERGRNQLSFQIAIDQPPLDLQFTYYCDPDENFYGFGTQYTEWGLKGKRLPIVVSEQGVGRGKEPLSFTINLFEKGASGDWSSTYAPKPLYITNHNNSIVFENDEIMIFDLREKNRVSVEILFGDRVVGSSLNGNILYGSSPLEIVKEITEITGRMPPLPQWTQTGAIIGLEGGTPCVTQIVDDLIANKVPISAIWLQDWVDIHKTMEGDRLCWCWKLDNKHYPQWDKMTASWKSEYGIRTMTYINPYFSDIKNNVLRDEGIAAGYFVKTREDKPYIINSGSIRFNILDLKIRMQ